jgi:hypothetical protein
MKEEANSKSEEEEEADKAKDAKKGIPQEKEKTLHSKNRPKRVV